MSKEPIEEFVPVKLSMEIKDVKIDVIASEDQLWELARFGFKKGGGNGVKSEVEEFVRRMKEANEDGKSE